MGITRVLYVHMTKKLTITIDDEVYEGLYRRIGRRRISRFLETLARPHVIDEDLEAAYLSMAADETREAEAEEWAEGVVGDVADPAR
jgi:predicted CopG family antitoxin